MLNADTLSRCKICQNELLFSFYSIRKHIKRAHQLTFKDYEEKHAAFTGQRPRKFPVKVEPAAPEPAAPKPAAPKQQQQKEAEPVSCTTPPISVLAIPATEPKRKKAKSKRAASSKTAKDTAEGKDVKTAEAPSAVENTTEWPSGELPAASEEPAAAWFDGNQFQCKKCSYLTSSFDSLGAHLAHVHQASLEEFGGGVGEGGSANNSSGSSPCYTKTSMMYQCHVCMAEIYHEKSAISYHLHNAHGLDLDTYGRSYVVKQEKEVAATTATPPPSATGTPQPSLLASPAVAAAAASTANQFNSHHHQFLGIYNVYDPRAHHHHHQHQQHHHAAHHPHPGLPDPGFQNGFGGSPLRDHYDRPLMVAAEQTKHAEMYVRQLERARQFERTFHIENPHHFRYLITGFQAV